MISPSQRLTEREAAFVVTALDQLAQQASADGLGQKNETELRRAIMVVKAALHSPGIAAAPKDAVLRSCLVEQGGLMPIAGEAVASLKFHEQGDKYVYTEPGSEVECVGVTAVLGDEVFEKVAAEAIVDPAKKKWSNKKPLNVAMSQEESERERVSGLALRASIQKVLNNNKLHHDSLGSCTLDVKDCGDGLEAQVVAGLQTFFTRYRQYVGTIVKADAHVVSKKLRLAGTVDVLAKAQDGSFTLVNWKREDKDISQAASNSKVKGPLLGKALANSNLNKHKLELNICKMILEQSYTLPGKIGKMFVVQLHPKLEEGLRVTEAESMPDEVALIERHILNQSPEAVVKGPSFF